MTGSATLTAPTEIFLTCMAVPIGTSSSPFEVTAEIVRMHALKVDLQQQ